MPQVVSHCPHPSPGPPLASASAPVRLLPILLAACCLAVSCTTTSRLPDGRRVWSAAVDPRLTGDRLLVIFMPDNWQRRFEDHDLENYGSWSRIIEAFTARGTAVKETRRVDFRSADEVFNGQGLPVSEYSLLFVRGDGLALFSNEPIYDGAVYDYAEAFLAGTERDFYWQGILHAGESESGMPRSLKLVRLRPRSLAKPAPEAPAATVYSQPAPEAPAPTLPEPPP